MIKDLRSDKKTDSNKMLDMTHSLLLENRERMALGGVTEDYADFRKARYLLKQFAAHC